MWGGGREDMGNPKFMLFSLWSRRQGLCLESVWSGGKWVAGRLVRSIIKLYPVAVGNGSCNSLGTCHRL